MISGDWVCGRIDCISGPSKKIFPTTSAKVISVEDHNQEAKAKINELLVSRGYVHVLEVGSAWDSWYVLPEVYEEMINRLGI